MTSWPDGAGGERRMNQERCKNFKPDYFGCELSDGSFQCVFSFGGGRAKDARACDEFEEVQP